MMPAERAADILDRYNQWLESEEKTEFPLTEQENLQLVKAFAQARVENLSKGGLLYNRLVNSGKVEEEISRAQQHAKEEFDLVDEQIKDKKDEGKWDSLKDSVQTRNALNSLVARQERSQIKREDMDKRRQVRDEVFKSGEVLDEQFYAREITKAQRDKQLIDLGMQRSRELAVELPDFVKRMKDKFDGEEIIIPPTIGERALYGDQTVYQQIRDLYGEHPTRAQLTDFTNMLRSGIAFDSGLGVPEQPINSEELANDLAGLTVNTYELTSEDQKYIREKRTDRQGEEKPVKKMWEGVGQWLRDEKDKLEDEEDSEGGESEEEDLMTPVREALKAKRRGENVEPPVVHGKEENIPKEDDELDGQRVMQRLRDEALRNVVMEIHDPDEAAKHVAYVDELERMVREGGTVRKETMEDGRIRLVFSKSGEESKEYVLGSKDSGARVLGRDEDVWVEDVKPQEGDQEKVSSQAVTSSTEEKEQSVKLEVEEQKSVEPEPFYDRVDEIAENRLDEPKVVKGKNGTIVYGTDEGFNYKSHNEDRVVVNTEENAFASIDGMGGMGVAGAGEKAAQIFAEEFQLGIKLKISFEDIQKKAHLRMSQEGIGEGGVCYVAGKIEGEILKIAQAGDARLLVIRRDGSVKFSTEDELAYPNVPNLRHVVGNAVQGTQEGTTKVYEVKLEEGDRIVVASDSLWDNYENNEVAGMVKGKH